MSKRDSGEPTRNLGKGQAAESRNPMMPPLLSSQGTWFWTVALVTHAWGLWEASTELCWLCYLPCATTPPGPGLLDGKVPAKQPRIPCLILGGRELEKRVSLP